MSHPERESELIRTFHLLTEAWIRGDLDLLERYYDPDIIGLEPEPPFRIRGRDRVLEAYRRFLQAGGRIDHLRARDIDVQRFGDTAVLTYFFETRRSLPDGGRWEFSGKETLVFLRREERWMLGHWHFSIDPASGPHPASGAGDGSRPGVIPLPEG